ncbi:MAG: hypothetical protein IJ088_09440 [Clostridia bacterium]|nr:hypothetical protein [Clostridia bacterium]
MAGTIRRKQGNGAPERETPPEGWNGKTDGFSGVNPWSLNYTVPESALVEITGSNRFRVFSTRCPICGKPISGRPAEYPYYRKFGDRTVFLCDFCDQLGRVSLRAD